MVHGPVTRSAPSSDASVIALLAGITLALTSAAFLLATPQVLQLLQLVLVPGLAPL